MRFTSMGMCVALIVPLTAVRTFAQTFQQIELCNQPDPCPGITRPLLLVTPAEGGRDARAFVCYEVNRPSSANCIGTTFNVTIRVNAPENWREPVLLRLILPNLADAAFGTIVLKGQMANAPLRLELQSSVATNPVPILGAVVRQGLDGGSNHGLHVELQQTFLATLGEGLAPTQVSMDVSSIDSVEVGSGNPGGVVQWPPFRGTIKVQRRSDGTKPVDFLAPGGAFAGIAKDGITSMQSDSGVNWEANLDVQHGDINQVVFGADAQVPFSIGNPVTPSQITFNVERGNIQLLQVPQLGLDSEDPSVFFGSVVNIVAKGVDAGTGFIDTINVTGDADGTAGAFGADTARVNITAKGIGAFNGLGDGLAFASISSNTFDKYWGRTTITGSVDNPLAYQQNSGMDRRSVVRVKTLNAPVDVRAAKFSGQVIVNAFNDGGTWNTTAASVTVGTTLLSPLPYYDNLSEPLGGGAVGLAPFALHAADCIPANASAWSPAPLGTGATPSAADWAGPLTIDRGKLVYGATANPQVRLRFYGPVTDEWADCGGIGLPGVVVTRSDDSTFVPSATNEVADVSHLFGINAPEDALPNLNRDLLLYSIGMSCSPKTGYYRVTPRPVVGGGLYIKCGEEVTGTPSVRDFVLYFRVPDVAPGDCNNLADVAGPGQSIGADGNLTADDIIVFLNWYFGGDSRADVAGPGQSMGPDQTFTADDIIVFLNRFFAGCDVPFCNSPPPDCGSSLIGGGQSSMQAGNTGQTDASRIAAMQAMINAETDPQRRAMLEAALQFLQGEPGDR